MGGRLGGGGDVGSCIVIRVATDDCRASSSRQVGAACSGATRLVMRSLLPLEEREGSVLSQGGSTNLLQTLKTRSVAVAGLGGH